MMKPLLDRISAPAAALLATTIVSGIGGIVAFLVLVPERVLLKLESMPWVSIFAIGVPLVVSAISAIRSAFVGPVVVAPSEKAVPHVSPDAVRSDAQPPSGGPHR